MASLRKVSRAAADLAERHAALYAALLGVAGAVLIYIGTIVLNEVTAEVRIVAVVAGLVCLYIAFARCGKALFGNGFEADVVLVTAWIAIIILAAIFADLLPLQEARSVSKTLQTPTLLRPDLFSNHPLGTDRQGLDLLGGVVYGARISLVVGLCSVAIGMFIGGSVGMIAGARGGKFDVVSRLITDAMLAFPALILLLGMVAVFGASVRNVTIALGVLGIPTYIRLARANTLLFAQREFVTAARAMGERRRAIIIRELLPNVVLPVLSFGFIMVAVLIVAESSLSFLGLSVQRPTPTWGNMISAGQANYDEDPHLVFVPGIVLFLTVFSFNRLGDKARRAWSPTQVQM